MALTQIDGENITVGSAKIGFTSTILVDRTNKETIIEARCRHKSGGQIHHNSKTDPTAAGVTGDQGQVLDDEWIVRGGRDLANFQMIKQTGEADAVVAVQFFGAP